MVYVTPDVIRFSLFNSYPPSTFRLNQFTIFWVILP